jgi:hypothetical protein
MYIHAAVHELFHLYRLTDGQTYGRNDFSKTFPWFWTLIRTWKELRAWNSLDSSCQVWDNEIFCFGIFFLLYFVVDLMVFVSQNCILGGKRTWLSCADVIFCFYRFHVRSRRSEASATLGTFSIYVADSRMFGRMSNFFCLYFQKRTQQMFQLAWNFGTWLGLISVISRTIGTFIIWSVYSVITWIR